MSTSPADSDAPRSADHDPVTIAVHASRRSYACVLAIPGRAPTSDPGPDGLAPAVARLFDTAGIAPTDLDEIRLDLGPGSYTGLRVAVTWARTLQELGGVTVRTATSLELLALHAWRHLDVASDAVVRPVLDARRDRYHHAPVQLDASVQLLDPPQATSADTLLERVTPGEVLLAESSVTPTLQATAEHRGCLLLPAPVGQPLALAALLLDPALLPRLAAPTDLEPLYLMGSYADS